MKGYLYAFASEGRWSASVTIAPEVDLAYRLDAGFRRAVEAAASCGDEGAAARFGGRADVVLLLDEPLPLGIAFSAAEVFARRARRVQGEAEAARLLRACAREAEPRDGRPGLAGLNRSFGREQPAGDVRRIAAVRFGRASGEREARMLAAAAREAAAALEGRALLRGEALALLGAAGPAPARWSAAFADAALQLAALLGRLRLGSAIARGDGVRGRRRKRRCLRCGSGEARMRRTPCAACGRVCAYCEACLLLGRCRECTLLVSGIPEGVVSVRMRSADALPPIPARLERWGLSPAQSDAAAAALRWLESADHGARRGISGQLRGTVARMAALCNIAGTPGRKQTAESAGASAKERPPFLLWAVTGAGKTEMMFTLIDSVLARGGKAMVATPRRDVVLELEPRIRKAFPEHTVVALHGASREKWTKADITLATTHQTIRFAAGFELVVIDELDAFPYHNNPMLQYAAAKCVAPGGHRVLLSATPPADMRRAAAKGRLPHARIPVRYHGHPLPVPVEVRVPPVREMIRRGTVPDKLKRAVRSSLSRGAQLFVFVPRISDTGPAASLLGTICPPDAAIGFTSSQDEQRTETVMRFRQRELRVLVTTTILERGVTIPRSDVFVLDADAPLFDEASLEQMAGRAGRSKDDPHGRVYFCAPHATRAQRAAIREIRAMNALAASRGYIRGESLAANGKASARGTVR
jgi:competence protein ComFA